MLRPHGHDDDVGGLDERGQAGGDGRAGRGRGLRGGVSGHVQEYADAGGAESSGRLPSLPQGEGDVPGADKPDSTHKSLSERGARPRRGSELIEEALLNEPRALLRRDLDVARGEQKFLSPTRCMPPSMAYVRPLQKSMSRLASSVSEPCRLMITGTSTLNLSAICWASLKFFR